MKEQHELDRLLKDKFDGREFDFQEAYWAEAAELISATEGQRKMPLSFLWRWLAVDSLMLILIFSFGYRPTSEYLISPLYADMQRPIDTTAAALQQHASSLNSSLFSTQTPASDNLLAENHSSKNPSSSPELTESLSQKERQETVLAAHSKFVSPDPGSSPGTGKATNRHKADSATASLPTLYELQQLLTVPDAHGQQPFNRLSPGLASSQHIRRQRFALVVGLQSARSFNSSEQPQWSHWPTIGIGYSYAMHARIRLQSGLMLENRAALFQSKSFISTSFGFGRNEENTLLLPQSMHYVAMPLQMSYRLQKRHSLAVGMQAAWLLDVHSTLETHITDAFGNISEKSEKAWGYRQGFNRLDGGLLLGYQFQFRPRSSLILEAYQGLRDVTKDAFWERTDVDRQLQLRLKLKWNLW